MTILPALLFFMCMVCSLVVIYLLIMGEFNKTSFHPDFLEATKRQEVMRDELNYDNFVKSRTKDPGAIAAWFTVSKAQLTHAAMGISGEAGELLDAIKKHVIYNKPLDRENVIEELGDIEFYLSMLRQELAVTRDDVLWCNKRKLEQRYPQKYTDELASERRDKQ